MLRRLALRRQAALSDEVLEIYTNDLSRFNLDDIKDACEAIGGEKRTAGEKALPEIGVLIEECNRLGRLRRDPDTDKVWSIYECRLCKTTQAGQHPHACVRCGGWTDCIHTDTKFDHTAYMRGVREHPEDFVRIGDVMREAVANLAKRSTM